MKKTFKLFGNLNLARNAKVPLLFIALVVVVGFSMVACSNLTDDESEEGSGTTFTSIEDFNKWLEKQPQNTPNTPYRVKLNTKDGSFGGHLLRYLGNGGKYVYLDISDSTITSIGEGAFDGCDTLVGITIGNSVTSIGSKAFSGSGLINITIPNSVTNIGEEAFFRCESLTSITIGSSVTSIGDSAFYLCTSLTSVNIPNSVTSIRTQAFWQCTGLTRVTIGSGVTSIGGIAFQYCTNLTSVTFEGTITSGNFDSSAFGSSDYYGYIGDLRDKFYETDSTNGTPGTYIRSGSGTWESPYTWTKQT